MGRGQTLVYREGHGCVSKEEAAQIDRANAKPAVRADFLPNMVERGSWVYRNGELVPKQEAVSYDVKKNLRIRSSLPAPNIMGDIKPYRNVIDGKEISSRSTHREFLRRNNVIEVGNEKMAPKNLAPSRGEIRREIKETIEQLEQGYDFPELRDLAEAGSSAGDEGELSDFGGVSLSGNPEEASKTVLRDSVPVAPQTSNSTK